VERDFSDNVRSARRIPACSINPNCEMSLETETNQQPTLRSAHQPIAGVAQAWSLAILIGTSVSFVVGLFIVNVHLARHGVFATSFLRTDYILAGTLFLIGVVVSTFALFEGLGLWRVARERWAERKRGSAVAGFILAPLSLLIVPSVLLLNASGMQLSVSTALIALFVFSYTGVFLRSFLQQSTGIWTRLNRESDGLAVRSDDLRRLVNTTPLLAAFIAMYAVGVYPDLSAAIGGGHRTAVLLVVNDRGMQIAVSLGMPVHEDSRIGPVQPLMETESEMIFLAASDAAGAKKRTIRFQRSLIEAVVSAR
jgi:hypothetical protein